MTENEARELVEEADLNKDGRINYREFARFIIDTIEKAKRVARKKMNKIITEKQMEKEMMRRSPSLRSESRYTDDMDSKILKKPRKNSVYDSDLEREHMMKRPSSGNLKRMLKNELELARENSTDSFRSTSKMKHHRNEAINDYYEQEERPKRRSSEREYERERERDFDKDRRKYHTYNNHHEDDLIKKREFNYDEDRMSRHSDRRDRSSREASRERNRDHYLVDDTSRPHRSRSHDKEIVWDKEFELDKEKNNERSNF